MISAIGAAQGVTVQPPAPARINIGSERVDATRSPLKCTTDVPGSTCASLNAAARWLAESEHVIRVVVVVAGIGAGAVIGEYVAAVLLVNLSASGARCSSRQSG